ncbi:MAG: GNAT family N-acetyltransferase [Thiolinea sp.]
MIQPVLITERLSLRPFVRSDAADVQRLAGDERIADVTANIPYPYPDGLAEEWISGHQPEWKAGTRASFAITHRENGVLLGAISLMHIADEEAEIGYWLGVDGWGKGYATEACCEILRFARENLRLVRVHARVLARNPASGRVLEKAGMRHIGLEEGACGYRNACESIELYELRF